MYLLVYCFELNSSWLGFISLIEIRFWLMRVFLYVLKIVKQNLSCGNYANSMYKFVQQSNYLPKISVNLMYMYTSINV